MASLEELGPLGQDISATAICTFGSGANRSRVHLSDLILLDPWDGRLSDLGAKELVHGSLDVKLGITPSLQMSLMEVCM